jgi:uracil-DNA glycosylase family 4
MVGTPPDTYCRLVLSRKECRLCEPGLTNPAACEAGAYDSDDIGPWSRWHGKFNPKLMIVGQDWGDTECYKRQLGKEDPNSPTNKVLTDLVRLIGLEMDAVFLTNAILCLKDGGLQAPVRKEWFRNCEHFLKQTIEIVNPKVLVTLGNHAYQSVERIFGLPRMESFEQAVDRLEGFRLPHGIRLFPVYHCSRRIQNTHRPLAQQKNDWLRIKPALSLV